jgi:hypothetical protein
MKTEVELKQYYKCTLGTDGGWCDGTRHGKSMRCPQMMRCKDNSRACRIGVRQGWNQEMAVVED